MKSFVKKEAVFCIAALLAVISVFFVPPDAEYIGYINFRVLALLFSLMAIVGGFRGLNVLDGIARFTASRCSDLRALITVLVMLCFFSSMVITNDVALLTFVPLAIGVLKISGGEKHIIYTVILQTVAANMGSMLTPMGNPQNLYLSDFYSMSVNEFFGATAPVCIVSGILILIMMLPVKREKIVLEKAEKYNINKPLTAMYILLLVLALMSVFNVTKWLYIVLTVVTFLLVLVFDREVLKKVDWFLLLTFVMFFIFVGNAARIDFIKEFLGGLTSGREIIVGAVASQFISNVPASVMLSSFTDRGTALMVGVDIGGLGTPIASLASLISYRLYSQSENRNKGKYMLQFLIINFALLAMLLVFGCFLYR
jgi:Na+/H+ antiporter NhaD/arsenite permease-like protein